MKIATWNVNSLRVRLSQVLEWLSTERPDILALQETKLADKDFPVQEIASAGYQAVFTGEKGYNGVALLSRLPLQGVARELPGWQNGQSRFLAANCDGVRVVNLYVPNGAQVGSEKYAYKLAWLESLSTHLETQLATYPCLVVLGDFNIAPEARDVHDPQVWEGHVLVSGPERAAFQKLLALDLIDAFRLFNQELGEFTWWDYRASSFRRNWGLRIDHVLITLSLH